MKRFVPMLVLAGAAALVAACDETLEGGLGCGVLCPERPAPLEQDTLDAVVLDSSIGPFPTLGAETQLIIAMRGDTLDARAIIRFDSLPATFRHDNTVVDSSIVDVDSAAVVLRFAGIDTLAPSFTLEAYDVDVTAGDDTSGAILVPRFDPSRLLGSATFDPKALHDSIPMRVPIDTAKLREKVQAEPQFRRLRVGIKMVASQSTELRVVASNGGSSPLLKFRPSFATTVPAVSLGVLSKTPPLPTIAGDLGDFQLIAKAPPAAPANVVRVGGIPGIRGYMRFSIPTNIIDSSTIVRAQLLLTQRPNREGAASADSGAVQPFALSAGGAITDLQRAMLFLAAGFDSTRVVPADSGVLAFELIDIVRSWRATDSLRTPRAIALRSTTEGTRPWQADFFSAEAPAAVRPKLVITYVPQPLPRVP